MDADPLVLAKLQDAMEPGFGAEFDPDEAVMAGAFREDALPEWEVLDAGIDIRAARLLAASKER